MTGLKPMVPWTQAEALELARKLEEVCQKFGCHIGLTGGLLYKDGARKDCDFVVYRAGQADPTKTRPPFPEEIDRDMLITAIEIECDLVLAKEWTRVVKFKTNAEAKPIDLLFPECDGAYPKAEEEDPDLALQKQRDDAAEKLEHYGKHGPQHNDGYGD